MFLEQEKGFRRGKKTYLLSKNVAWADLINIADRALLLHEELLWTSILSIIWDLPWVMKETERKEENWLLVW